MTQPDRLRWPRRIAVAGLAFVMLCAGLMVTSRTMTRPCTALTDAYDIAVVLGGGMRPDGTLAPSTQLRVDAGVHLFQSGQAKRLHMTGGAITKAPASLGGAMRDAAIAAGVPAEKITAETHSLSTLQNAFFSAPYVEDFERRVIVTEPYHALRGQASFWWAGLHGDRCGSAPSDDTLRKWSRDSLRETLAWGLNLVRAPLYSLTARFGMPETALN